MHNRILISAWFADLHFSASTTVRPKLCGQSARRVLVIEIFFFFKKFLEYLGLPENAWHYPNFQLLLNFGHPIRYSWKIQWNWKSNTCKHDLPPLWRLIAIFPHRRFLWRHESAVTTMTAFQKKAKSNISIAGKTHKTQQFDPKLINGRRHFLVTLTMKQKIGS